MTDILMPALSPTMEEGTLSKWTVKAGDTVKSGDVIAEIETDKATMEVEAVDEGVVEALLVPEGTEGVKVNTPIARLKGEGEAASPPPGAGAGQQASPPQSPAAPPTAPPQAGEQDAVAPPQSSPVDGGGGSAEGRDGGGLASKPEDGARAARDTSAQDTREANIQGDKAQREPAPASSAPPAQAAPRQAELPAGDTPRIFASPLARRLAQAKGIDLTALKGSGPHGRIVRADIDAAQPGVAPAASSLAAVQPSALRPDAPPSPAEAPRQAKSLEQMGIAPGSYDLHPLNGMKKTVARRMTESWRDIPHFPLTIDLRLDELLSFRTKLNARLEIQGVKVSVNDVLIKCAALALMAEPEANASYTPDGIAWHHAADVAVAVAVEGGLITPIVRAAETRGLADIARAMKDLAERARDRKLKPEEYLGGTFSISNLGMFGIKSFASIINEPQGMILSVGAGEKRPVVDGDQLAVATVMTVTLTCDHRVVDGAIGARWLAAFKGFVEDPITMLA